MPASKQKKHGRRASAGRSPLKAPLKAGAKKRRPQGQAIAFGIMARALCLLLLLVPAASTLSDEIQDMVTRSLTGMQGAALSDKDIQTRASLLRRVAADTDAVRRMNAGDIRLLFGDPALVRHEEGVESVHYVTAECALDVYYKGYAAKPSYVEYRLRGAGDGAAHKACLQALFAGAKFTQPEPAATRSASAPSGGRV